VSAFSVNCWAEQQTLPLVHRAGWLLGK